MENKEKKGWTQLMVLSSSSILCHFLFLSTVYTAIFQDDGMKYLYDLGVRQAEIEASLNSIPFSDAMKRIISRMSTTNK